LDYLCVKQYVLILMEEQQQFVFQEYLVK
jgi:hypothetical protein